MPCFVRTRVVAVVTTAVWSFFATVAILYACKVIPFIGLRPSKEKEDLGMDMSIHCTPAYDDSSTGGGSGGMTLVPISRGTEDRNRTISLVGPSSDGQGQAQAPHKGGVDEANHEAFQADV